MSANVAYCQVNLEPGISGGGEYVIPAALDIQSSSNQELRYEDRVGRESVVYDLPT